MTDLRAFIEARLAEDEAKAKRAGWEHPVWTYDREVFVVASDGWCIAARKDDGTPINDVDGTHIARHDPARVLREVAAKRAILARHAHGDRNECVGCGYMGDMDDPRIDEELENCPELLDLAAIFADHPDY